METTLTSLALFYFPLPGSKTHSRSLLVKTFKFSFFWTLKCTHWNIVGVLNFFLFPLFPLQQKVFDPCCLGRHRSSDGSDRLVSSARVPFLAGRRKTEAHHSKLHSDRVCTFSVISTLTVFFCFFQHHIIILSLYTGLWCLWFPQWSTVSFMKR